MEENVNISYLIKIGVAVSVVLLTACWFCWNRIQEYIEIEKLYAH